MDNHANPNKSRILVLDDEKSIRTIVFRLLKLQGHEVHQAGDLAEARKILAGFPIDLVLCDIGLAGESGLDLLDETSHRSPELVSVMMTGNDDTRTAIKCLRNGAFDYLLKPFSNSNLDEIVSRVLARQREMKAERSRIEDQLQILGKFSSENPNPVMRVAVDGTLLYANDASFAFLEELEVSMGSKLPEFLRHLILGVQENDEAAVIELDALGRCYSLAVTPIKDEDYVYLYGHDISTLKRAEEELTRLKNKAQTQALHDPLTGLPNRTFLEQRFAEEVARCDRENTKLLLAFIDLDHFKQINDTQGHKVGDEVLKAMAGRLQGTLRKCDTVARWGGDEMILLMPEIETHEAKAVCERIKSTVQREIAEEDGYYVTMSMGAAIYPNDNADPEQLLISADEALLLVKERARNKVLLFSECRELDSCRQQADIRSRFTRAISNRKIQVHYQPLVDAATGQAIAAEALARWQEDGEWISPAMFIPLAENMGLIEDLGSQVQELALVHLSNCHQKGFPLTLSINISQRQLLRAGYATELVELAEQCGLSPDQVTLEMTEREALLGLNSELERLKELSEAGFLLSIDDFGQGYSSLASLHEMPVNELKIDMKFVRNLHTSKGRRIVQTILELASTLELDTVAEGVETKEQYDILRDLGAHKLQGYFFSKALPGPEFFAYLENQSQTGVKRGVKSIGGGRILIPEDTSIELSS